MKHEPDELPVTWYIVLNASDTDGTKTAVYERVGVHDDGTIGEYRLVDVLDEVRRNH